MIQVLILQRKSRYVRDIIRCMRPILCVIDLRETSVKVLEVASRMAHAYKSHLTILFPYRLIDTKFKLEVSKLKIQLEEEAKENFQSLVNQVPLLKQLSYEFQPEIGFPADRISSFVKRNKVAKFAIGKGYESDVVWEFVKDILPD